MKLSELLCGFQFDTNSDISELEIESVTSRIEKTFGDTLFVLYKSIKAGTRSIIEYVLHKRPRAIIADRDIEIPPTDIPIIKVDDARRLYAYIYARFLKIDFDKMKFIGITGTNGKTTTATVLSKIFENAGHTVGLIGTGEISVNGRTINEDFYSMTTPDPDILYPALKHFENAGCDTVIMEVSSHALYLGKVAPIKFEASIFTNLSAEHMDFHKSIEDYYKAKFELFRQSRLGIFNVDDYYARRAYEESECEKLTFGVIRRADANATDVSIVGVRGIRYIYRDKVSEVDIESILPGAYNVYNTMAALVAAIALGVEPCVAKSTLHSFTGVAGRFELVAEKPMVIIDYAHTPEALTNVLKTILLDKKSEQKLILVFGCGGERDRDKRPKMARIAEKYADLSIVTTDNSRGESVVDILEDILSGFRDTRRRCVISSRAAAIEKAIMSANYDDIVAIIGKGGERYNIDKSGYHPFDERKIIQKALKKREEQKNANNTQDPADA